MSRPGNPYDNATCESFFKTLKREEIHANNYEDLEHVLEGIGAFIERYYNRTRLHSALGYRSPAEFEVQSTQLSPQANVVGAALKLYEQQERPSQLGRETRFRNNAELVSSIRTAEDDVCQSEPVSARGSL
jgi:Integrase core domain